MSATALSLFDQPADPAPARASDPETSHAAVATVNIKERKREVLAAMQRLDRAATASEIQQEMRRHGVIREAGTIRSRLAQLKRDGTIRKTGGVRKVSKDEGGTGCNEQLWVVR